MIEVWFRNPDNYIRECLEIGVMTLAWDRGYLVKKSLDPSRFADLYYSASMEYRMLAVGDQGTAELRRGQTLANPAAVYPTWEYGQELELLEDMLAHPAGDDPSLCGDTDKPVDERPVAGQEHRVVVIRLPPVGTGVGRKVLRQLAEMQSEYPDAILHLHGLYSWRAMFSLSIRSVDVEPRILAQKGKVTLPNGKEVTYERAAQTPQWVRVCGMAPSELAVPRNRCIYNMRSAQWAAKNFTKNVNFRVSGGGAVDPDAKVYVPEPTGRFKTTSLAATLGDKFLCDVCSLQDTCKYYREGSVCTLPDTETNKLSQMFGSRDAEDIVEALGVLLAKQVERLQRGIENEEVLEELDPEVSKAFNAVFTNGVKLAKLRDPKLSGGPLVGINLNVPRDLLEGAQPAQLTAAAVKALEEKGIERKDITPDMLQRVLQPALDQSASGIDEVDDAVLVDDD